MNQAELQSIQSKYQFRVSTVDSIPFVEASRDVRALLDALPNSPRNQLLRSKYSRVKPDHPVAFWLVAQDVELLASEVKPIEAETAIVGEQSVAEESQSSLESETA